MQFISQNITPRKLLLNYLAQTPLCQKIEGICCWPNIIHVQS